MGILQRLSLLLRSNINDAISRGENPEKVLNQLIIDMREQLTKAKQEVAVAIADERRLKAQMEDEHKQARDWEHRAMLALREGREDLAKQALIRQQEHGERGMSLEETWQKQATETEKLKGSLQQLNDKIEEAKRKKNLLVAKQKRAQAQKRIHETMAGLNDKSAFDTFERVAEKIEENERRALAAAEVSETLSGDTLEKEFAQLGSGGESVEYRLMQLKQQMGLPLGPGDKAAQALPGGGSGADSRRLGAGDAAGPAGAEAATARPVSSQGAGAGGAHAAGSGSSHGAGSGTPGSSAAGSGGGPAGGGRPANGALGSGNAAPRALGSGTAAAGAADDVHTFDAELEEEEA